jgi:hypothetical protein
MDLLVLLTESSQSLSLKYSFRPLKLSSYQLYSMINDLIHTETMTYPLLYNAFIAYFSILGLQEFIACFHTNILSCDGVIIDEVWIGNWIY